MKMKSLSAGIALGAVAAFGIATAAQARVDLFIDSGDYWRHHHYDSCYYRDCGDDWYFRHHRHFWRDRDSWRGGGDWGDRRGGGWRDHRGGDWHGRDGGGHGRDGGGHHGGDGGGHHGGGHDGDGHHHG